MDDKTNNENGTIGENDSSFNYHALMKIILELVNRNGGLCNTSAHIRKLVRDYVGNELDNVDILQRICDTIMGTDPITQVDASTQKKMIRQAISHPLIFDELLRKNPVPLSIMEILNIDIKCTELITHSNTEGILEIIMEGEYHYEVKSRLLVYIMYNERVSMYRAYVYSDETLPIPPGGAWHPNLALIVYVTLFRANRVDIMDNIESTILTKSLSPQRCLSALPNNSEERAVLQDLLEYPIINRALKVNNWYEK